MGPVQTWLVIHTVGSSSWSSPFTLQSSMRPGIRENSLGKLRSCDLVKLRVRDVCHGSLMAARAMVMQQKTQRPVQFEITEQTRESLLACIRAAGRRSDDYLFPSRIPGSPHLSTRQYARIVRGWVRGIGLDSSAPEADGPNPRGCPIWTDIPVADQSWNNPVPLEM